MKAQHSTAQCRFISQDKMALGCMHSTQYTYDALLSGDTCTDDGSMVVAMVPSQRVNDRSRKHAEEAIEDKG